MPFDVVQVSAGGALDALEGPWLEIERAGGVTHPMYSWPWVATWWEVFGDTRTLTAVIERDGARATAIAPFVRYTARMNRCFPVRRLALLGTGEPECDEVFAEYADLPCVPRAAGADAAPLMRELLRAAGGACDDLLLCRVRADSAVHRAARACAAGDGFVACDTETGTAPYIALPKSFEDYEKQLSSNRRQQARRGLRALEKLGAVRFTRAETVEAALETLDTLGRLHQERWTARGKPGCFASARFMRFHRRFIQRTFPLGWPHLWTLRLNDEPIVCLYNICHQGRIAFYQSGMKTFEQEDAIRPGMVAHVMAIRAAIEQGATEYDFMLGDSRYKTSLSNATRELMTLRYYRRTVRERVRSVAVSAARRVRALVRRPTPRPPATVERQES